MLIHICDFPGHWWSSECTSYDEGFYTKVINGLFGTFVLVVSLSTSKLHFTYFGDPCEVMICFSIQLLVSLFEVVAFGSGTSTSHQMQFKKLLKEIFEVCFMAWGITEDAFLYYSLISSRLI